MAHTGQDSSWREHIWLFVACGVMTLSPFQYGIDFGMIGGLQAMVGFLKVCQTALGVNPALTD